MVTTDDHPHPAGSRQQVQLLSVALTGLLAPAVLAGNNPFANVSSTAGGLSTWDGDLVNSDSVPESGRGVFVAVLDTGLVPNWTDYFPRDRVATRLGKGFYQPVSFKAGHLDPCGWTTTIGRLQESTWVGSAGSTHGTHVTSTILGYFYKNNYDTLAGYPLPPVMIRGIAPRATVIPIKVLADYQVPALPQCSTPTRAYSAVFGTSEMITAGINYATELARKGYRPMVINLSFGGGALDPAQKSAVDRAIANGVIVVAAAGNVRDAGMHYPGAYAPVISVGSAGWVDEWLHPNGSNLAYRLWWLQSPYYPAWNLSEPVAASDVYVSDFSSRALPGQELDVLAPGSWVRGPFPGDPGFSHLPWWSNGRGDLHRNPGNFYVVAGTSMATPHVAAAAALLLEKDRTLNQSQIEQLLKSTALAIAPGATVIFDPNAGFTPIGWGANATGAGLIQIDAALNAVP